MKKILFFIILPCILSAQGIVKTVGIVYTAGAPAHAPAAKVGSQVAIDTVTWEWYEYNGSAWIASGDRVQSVSGCSAPNYTPTKYDSRLVINACTALQGGPGLYYWTGVAWLQINQGQTYTEGTGIDITSGVITNTAPDISIDVVGGSGVNVTNSYPDITISVDDTSPTNEIQTLSVSGSNLTLSNGGGTVTIPGGGGGVSIYISNTAPADTAKIWANKLLEKNAAYPLLYYRPGGWIFTGQYYDRLAGQISLGLPLNILISGQSNIVGPFPNTRSVDAPGYVGDSTSSPMVVAVNYSGTWRKAVSSVWPPLFVSNMDGATHSMVAAKRIAAKTGRTVRLVICGTGGQPIEFWRPGATGWQELDSTMQRAYRTGMGKVDAFIWFHGEAGSTANTYQAQWDSLVARLRTRAYFDSTGTMILAPSNALAITDVYPGSIVAENTLRALDYDGDPATKYIRPLERKETNTLNDVFHYTPREHERIGRVYADAILSWEYRDRADGVMRLNGTNSVTTIFPRQDSVIWRVNLRTNNVGAYQRRLSFAGSNNSTFVENIKSTGGSSAFQMEWYFEASTTTPVAYINANGMSCNKPINALGTWDMVTADPTGGIVFNNVGGVGNDDIIARTSTGITHNVRNFEKHSFCYQLTERFAVGENGTNVVGKLGVNNSSPAASSVVDIVSTTGFLTPPRMTSAQRDAVASKKAGDTLYCTDCTATDGSTGVMQVYNGSTWKNCW